jgi:hypothetical protein
MLLWLHLFEYWPIACWPLAYPVYVPKLRNTPFRYVVHEAPEVFIVVFLGRRHMGWADDMHYVIPARTVGLPFQLPVRLRRRIVS